MKQPLLAASITRGALAVLVTAATVAAAGCHKASIAATFLCTGFGNPRLSVVYDQSTDPPSALVTIGDRHALMYAALAASGARYTATEVEFWEHHGEAAVRWYGNTYTCVAANRGG